MLCYLAVFPGVVRSYLFRRSAAAILYGQLEFREVKKGPPRLGAMTLARRTSAGIYIRVQPWCADGFILPDDGNPEQVWEGRGRCLYN